MARDDSSSPTISGGKHRRSPEGTREESSKRRKHRHRHSHRHGRDWKEDDAARPVEDEIEEGEILDDAQPEEIKLEGLALDLKKIRVCFLGSIFSSSLAVIFGMRFNRLLFHCSLITYLENLSMSNVQLLFI
jgi:hypothetical protein